MQRILTDCALVLFMLLSKGVKASAESSTLCASTLCLDSQAGWQVSLAHPRDICLSI